MSNSSKRIQWLDFGKGFTIFAVVLAHVFQFSNMNNSFIKYAVFTFIMPVFFAISGYLYHKCDTTYKYKILLYKKISSFILPYAIFTILLVIEKITLHQSVSSPLKYTFVPYGYLWFLYALFFIFLLVGIEDVMHISTRVQTIISVILLISQEYLPYQQGSKNINPFAGIFGYLICFYVGYICRRHDFSKHVQNVCHHNYILLFIAFWLLLLYVQYLLKPNCDTNVFDFSDVVTKLISIPLFLSIFILMPRLNYIFKYFDKYGKYTLVIYLIHLPFMGKITHLLTKLGAMSFGNIVFMLILMIVIWNFSILFCFIETKIKIIHIIFYPRGLCNRLISKIK